MHDHWRRVYTGKAAEGGMCCSGLPVARYSPETSGRALVAGFRLVEHPAQDHRTPAAAVQRFNHCHFINSDSSCMEIAHAYR